MFVVKLGPRTQGGRNTDNYLEMFYNVVGTHEQKDQSDSNPAPSPTLTTQSAADSDDFFDLIDQIIDNKAGREFITRQQ